MPFDQRQYGLFSRDPRNSTVFALLGTKFQYFTNSTAKLIEKTNLKFPIILSQDGQVMNGVHRVMKAFIKGHKRIKVVQFTQDPMPDYIGVEPDDLPYDRSGFFWEFTKNPKGALEVFYGLIDLST